MMKRLEGSGIATWLVPSIRMITPPSGIARGYLSLSYFTAKQRH